MPSDSQSKYDVRIDQTLCKGCGICVSVCPKGVLALNLDTINPNGYNPSSVARIEECIGCANCAIMCPDSAISIYKED